MQYPSLAHLRNMEEVCVLSLALTNHRSARLTVALIRYTSALKSTPFHYIGVDGRAKTGIIAGTAKSGPTLFHKDIYGYSAFNEIVFVTQVSKKQD